jgi:hypothetical protein
VTWSFESAREPAAFPAGRAEQPPDDPAIEHALGPEGALCGIPRARITMYRHLFFPQHPAACPACVKAAAEVPAMPSVQERLHDRVLEAQGGPLRNELLAVLRAGAKIRLWVNGDPMDTLRHVAGLEQVPEGIREVRRLGVAAVPHDGGEFVVLLPEGGTPFITRAQAA